MKLKSFLCSTLFLALGSSGTAFGFDLVDAKGTCATIVVPAQAPETVKLAAWELQNYVHKITGKTMPIANDQTFLEGNVVFVGTTGFAAEKKAPFAPKDPLEYLVEVTDKRVVLAGVDAKTVSPGAMTIDYAAMTGAPGGPRTLQLPQLFDRRGSLRATYELLDRLGVKFYGPKEISVTYPKKTSLTIESMRVVRRPSLLHTSGSLTWGWPLMKGLYGSPSHQQLGLFALRIGLGGQPWYTNHTMHSYRQRFPRDKYPEIYPPKSYGGNQLCYSSQKLAELVAKDAQDYFAGKEVPGLTLPPGGDFFPVVPNDCGNYCTCPQCQAVLQKDVHRAMFHEGRAMFNNGQASNYWYGFINRVARLVKKTNPDKFISTLSYEQYYWLPEFELESNVSVTPCMHSPRLYMGAKTMKNELDHYNEWIRLSQAGKIGPVFLWNYLGFPEEPSVIRGYHCFPGFSAHKAAEMIRKFARDGVAGIFFCGIGEQLDFYVIMSLAQHAERDPQAVIDAFFRDYFGAAAEPMQKFYTLIEDTFFSSPANIGREGHQTQDFAWRVLGTEEVLEKLHGYMKEATKLADTPADKERVALWKTVYDYMRKGKDQYMRTYKKLISTPPHNSVAADYIQGIHATACWDGDAKPFSLVTGFHMQEAQPGVLGTRDAKLDITNDANRHWSAINAENAWVEFDLGASYYLEEIRIWNYQQNRGYGISRRGMRQVEITANATLDISTARTVFQGIIPEGDDKAAFSVSKVIALDGKKPVRYVRITAKGPVGTSNWSRNPKAPGQDWAGLGQVRFYGKKVK